MTRAMKLVLCLVIVFSMVSCATTRQATQEELGKGDFGPFPYDYRLMIQEHLSTRLLDPLSAMYYFSKPRKARDGKRYGWLVKMEVNSRNRMGGYVGRKVLHYMIYYDEIWQCNCFSTGVQNAVRSGIN